MLGGERGHDPEPQTDSRRISGLGIRHWIDDRAPDFRRTDTDLDHDGSLAVFQRVGEERLSPRTLASRWSCDTATAPCEWLGHRVRRLRRIVMGSRRTCCSSWPTTRPRRRTMCFRSGNRPSNWARPAPFRSPRNRAWSRQCLRLPSSCLASDLTGCPPCCRARRRDRQPSLRSFARPSC